MSLKDSNPKLSDKFCYGFSCPCLEFQFIVEFTDFQDSVAIQQDRMTDIDGVQLIIQVEKERGQVATGIECYMNDNGVTKEEAVDKFFEMATNSWKDINEECLRPSSHSIRDVQMRILNLERIIDITYKNNEDGYTQPEKVLKPHIIALFVDPKI